MQNATNVLPYRTGLEMCQCGSAMGSSDFASTKSSPTWVRGVRGLMGRLIWPLTECTDFSTSHDWEKKGSVEKAR